VDAPGDPCGAGAQERALENLLQDLGPQLRRASVCAQGAGNGRGAYNGQQNAHQDRSPTGLAHVDRLLGGGFPRGRLSEIAGPPSSGRTSLALSLLAEITSTGRLAAWIDGADAFDAASAASAGVDLDRVLWIRPSARPEALRCADHVLTAGGFDGVFLDLAGSVEAGSRPLSPLPVSAWTRLRKTTAAAEATLVILVQERMAGSFADLAVELEEARPHFLRSPDWLAGLEGQVKLVRNRLGPGRPAVPVRWKTAA